MAGSPPPPPPAQRPLTPTCYNRILGMGADNLASQHSRPNSEILSSTPFPTCEVGNSWHYGSFGVGPYSYDRYHNQAEIQKNGYDLLQNGTGVFHPTRVSTEYRRAHYNNIKERRIRQGGGREDNGNCRNGRGENSSKEKKKNDGPLKKKEECHNPLRPLKNEPKGKKEKEKEKKYKKKNGGSEKKEEECYVPNLPPGIVLPMEWPYPDSF